VSGDVFDHSSGRLSKLDEEVVRHVPPGGNWRDLPEGFESKRIEQIRRSAAAGEGSRSTYYGRLSPGRQSYTISTYFNRPGNGCFIHPHAPRLISIREAARLQGFADDFRFIGRGRARYLQVGNAVPPLLAFQLARALGPGARFLDLFSGAGGLSSGFEWAGHELVAAVDNDPSCIATLVANGVEPERALQRDLSAPGALDAVLGEIVALNGGEEVEILVGGPPCQGFSTAGNNKRRDPRNRLLEVFLEAVVALRPRVVLMENVPALTFRRSRARLERMLAALRAQGYLVETAILHAEGYGLPQLRRRLFVQAVRDGEVRWPAPHSQILAPHQLKMQPGGGDLPEDRLDPPTVEQAIGDLPAATTLDPDLPARYAHAAASPYQRWARGAIAASDLLPDTVPIAIADGKALEAA
jgi:DNA (cytosine-5)-methyltransferase 1